MKRSFESTMAQTREEDGTFATKEEALEYLGRTVANPRDICQAPSEFEAKFGLPESTERVIKVELIDPEKTKEGLKKQIEERFYEEIEKWRLGFFWDNDEKKKYSRKMRREKHQKEREWGIGMASDITLASLEKRLAGETFFAEISEAEFQRATRQAIILTEIAMIPNLGPLDPKPKSELGFIMNVSWESRIRRLTTAFGEKLPSEKLPLLTDDTHRPPTTEELKEATENIWVAHLQGWLFEKISSQFPPQISQEVPPESLPFLGESEPAAIKSKKILGQARKKESLAKAKAKRIEESMPATYYFEQIQTYVRPSSEEWETARSPQEWIRFYEERGITLPQEILKLLLTNYSDKKILYPEIFKIFNEHSFKPLRNVFEIRGPEVKLTTEQEEALSNLEAAVAARVKKNATVPDAVLVNHRGEIIGILDCKCWDEAEIEAFLTGLERQTLPSKNRLVSSFPPKEVEKNREVLAGERFSLPLRQLDFGIDIAGFRQFYKEISEYSQREKPAAKIRPLQAIILRLSADWGPQYVERLQRIIQERVTAKTEILAKNHFDEIDPDTAEETQTAALEQITPFVYLERVDLFDAWEVRTIARKILERKEDYLEEQNPDSE